MTGAAQPIAGASWVKTAAPNAWGGGRAWFALASVTMHALAVAALTVFVRSASMPERADETPIEMVFAPPVAEPAPPEPSPPEPVVEATAEEVPPQPATVAPPPPPAPLPEPAPAPEPVSQPPPPPAPKPKPVRVAKAAPPVAATVAPAAPVAAPAPPPAPAPAPGDAPAPAPGDAPAVDPAWQSAVVAWLASHKTYPEESRRRGEEGRVAVRFTVDRSGRVLEADIATSSGVQRLDDAVAAMMRQAALPRFPTSMTRDRITITTTVRYSLR